MRNSPLKTAKKSLVVFIFIILILIGLVFQFSLIAGQTVLSSSYYRELIDNTGLPASLHKALQAELLREASDILPGKLASIAVRAISMVFDQAWVEEQFLVVSDHYLDYIRGKKDSPQLNLDLRGKKEELRVVIVSALEMIPGQFVDIIGLNSSDPEELASNLLSVLPLPDTVQFGQLFTLRGESGRLVRYLEAARFYRPYFTCLPVFFFFILFLILRGLSGTAGALKWFGGAALISGVIFSLALQLIRSYYIKNLAAALVLGSFIDPELFYTVLRHLIDRAAALSLYYALAGVLIMLAGGIIFWISSFAGKKGDAR